MREATGLSEKEKSAVAVAVTWVAGFVDAVGYLVLSRVFVAHQTGNTVGSALDLVNGERGESFRRGYPVAVFVAGLLLAEFVLEIAKRAGAKSILWRALALEAIFLLAFIACGTALSNGTHRRSFSAEVILITLATLAMGVQNASLRKIGVLTIFTTHITGTLSKLAEEAAKYVLWFHDRTRGRRLRRLMKVLRVTPRQENFRQTMLLASLWLMYFIGAALGAVGAARAGVVSLLIPLVVVLAVVGVDFVRPISPVP